MKPEEFIQKAKELVAEYENTRLKKQMKKEVLKWDRAKVEPEDVFIVWWSKTLQNAKAMLSTPQRNAMYYEVTLDGDKGKIYFDAYSKENNVAVDVEGGE